MIDPTEGRFTVETAIPGIAGVGDEVVVDSSERTILVTRRVSWAKYPKIIDHLCAAAQPLLPMDAFEAMTDTLRPLVSGLSVFDYESDSFSLFVDESYDLTEEGEHLLGELATRAADGAQRLGDVEGKTVHRLLPDRCERQLAEVRETLERVAWILWGASIVSDVLTPPDRPSRAAGLAYAMVRGAYGELG